MALDEPFSKVTTSEPAKQALEPVLLPTVLVVAEVAAAVVVRPEPRVGAMEVVQTEDICVCCARAVFMAVVVSLVLAVAEVIVESVV